MRRVKLLVRIFVFFTIMIQDMDAFLSDRVSYPELPVADYTLRKLTDETMVRVVARYFEESKPERYNPGDLLNLEPLTASSLFKEHFGDCVSSGHFRSAIQEVIEGNLGIERNKNDRSDWHFNAEQIHEGNRRMISLRRTVLASLNSQEPDFAGIRENIGKYLHLLQNFYSNTNWVEMYPDDINLDLGIRELTDPVVTPQDAPCRNCRNIPIAGRPESHDCSSSLNYQRRFRSLYSGYRSGQDIAKPAASGRSWGKCSHGGKYDSTWTQVATGGINKDSSDPAISPHYHLHQAAVMLAIRAGETFFNDQETGIKSLISTIKFQQLVNLDFGRSIAFVMDDTGSMADEIDAALNTATLLVTQFAQSCQTSKQCIVSPFNDPGIGPLTNSDNAQECADALGELYAHGGGDCPELAMSGLEAALEQIVYPAKVYVWTDADAKDEHKRAQVLELAVQKNAEITFFLTGVCGRRKRSTGSTDLYSQLSSATGGAVYHTTNNDISSISNIILAESTASEVAIFRWNNDDFTNVLLSIPVDNSMEKLIVKVSGPSPKLKTQLIDPSGSQISYETSSHEVIVDTSDLFIFTVDTTASGNWSLRLNHVTPGNAYHVEITASSFLDFVYQMMELSPGGLLTPIEGNPLAGSNVTFVIDIVSPELLQYANELLLHDSDGKTVLLRAPLIDIAGPALGMFTANVILPEQAFTVSIVGTDESGVKVQRLQTEIVEVLGFTLTISNNNNTADNLVPGESGSFNVDLSNTGADDTFDLNVIVTTRSSALTNPVLASVTPSNINLESGDSTSGVVTLDANQNARAGDSILVTVNMISRGSGERNFVSYSVTLAEIPEIVVPQEDDTIPPSCTILSTENGCTAERIQHNCASNFWILRASLQDNRAISLITVTDFEISNSSYTLDRSNAGNVDVFYESNCCCPNITVSVQDTSGNLDRCDVDYLVLAEGIDIGQCVRDCDETTECYNEGLCIGGRCECSPGFNGTLCENNIDECATDPCLHGGSCQDGIQSYICNCTDTGYEGLRCELDVDDCVEHSCTNNGLCIDEFKGYRCNCDGTGFEGTICETDINECQTDICVNDISCTNVYGSFICDCQPGWQGTVCDLNVNECESGTPCINNATCNDTPGSYLCDCPAGFRGNYCEIDINECESQPCEHGGVCTDMIGQYSCQCPSSYHGNDCQFDVNECDSSTLNNCHPNAVCHNTDGSYECQCSDGFEGNGDICTDLNECDTNNMNNCHTHAICRNTVGSFECQCSTGFEGDGVHCLDINECEDSTTINCHSNATCHNTDGSFVCQCDAGFEGNGVECSECGHWRYGRNCSEECTCINGASCYNVDGNCTCSKSFIDQACNKANLKVLITAQNTTINAEDNITLTCKVNLPAFDIGNMVTWVLPDHTTKNISQSDPDDSGMYVLELSGTHNASGRYRCIAQTDLRTKMIKADASIDIGIEESTGGVMLMATSTCGLVLAVFISMSYMFHH